MSLKKVSLYVFILLLLLSVYNDLTGQYPRYTFEENVRTETTDHRETFSAVQVRVQRGQSVLSITDQLNKHIEQIDIEQIMDDFRILNPGVDPLHLQPNKMYYFPLY